MYDSAAADLAMTDASATLVWSEKLLFVYAVVGLLCYFWWSDYTPTVLFTPLSAVFAVAAVAFVLESTSSIEQETATIAAVGAVAVLLVIYFCFRLLFYTVGGILLTLCLVPDASELSVFSFRYTARVNSASYIAISLLIPTVIGALAVYIGKRFVTQKVVRETLVYLWSSQAVVLTGYVLYHGLDANRVPKIVTSPPEATQWAWILAIALCAVIRAGAVFIAVRKHWCCNRIATELETELDAEEDHLSP